MKVWTMFKIMAGIWCIDYFITTVLLNCCEGFMEVNPIARFFFNYGFWGFVMAYFVTLSMILGYAYLIKWLSSSKTMQDIHRKQEIKWELKHGKHISERKPKFINNYENIERIMLGLFVIGDLVAITNNFILFGTCIK
jgi:hypothetical protein